MNKTFRKIFVEDKNTSKLIKSFNGLSAFVILALIFIFSVYKINYKFDFSSILPYKNKIIKAYATTLMIGIFSMIGALIIGTVMAIFKRSKYMILKYFSKLYIELIRGTPFLIQIFFFYFIIATAFGLNNKYILGCIILAVFSGAYVTEIIRGGLESISMSQHLSADSLGFTTFQKYRYVIFPQVIKRILPALTGQLSTLIKDSSLLSVIAVSELSMNILEIDSLNFHTFENLTLLGILYLTITIPISILSKKLERKYHYET